MTALETPDELRLENDRRLALSVVTILLSINLVFVVLNLRESGPDLTTIPPIVVVRLVGVLAAALITGALCSVRSQRALEHVSLAGSLCTVVLLMLIHLLSSATDMPGYAFDLVFVTTIFVALPSSPKLQVVPAAALSIGSLVMLCMPGNGVADTDKLRFFVFFIGAFSLGYISTVRRAQLWRDLIRARQAEWGAAVEADRAKRELQTLRGIIPICSHCHRVRIEDGRLWEAVDMYVSRRTDAAFSHGVCPDCLAEHYPNVRAE